MTQQPEYIGCIDGRAIVVRRQADEILLTFDEVEARLSIEAAIRLANLLPSATSLPITSDHVPRFVHSKVRQSRPRETIVDLIEEGLIQVGIVLTMRHYNVDHFGTLTSDGKIDIDGQKYETPSAAGKWVTGRQTCNGWAEWKVRDGISLIDLRWMLRAKRFPPINNGEVLWSQLDKQKNMIAMGWVDYALSKKLNPGARNESAIERYFEYRQLSSEYRYKDRTLEQYRRNLRHWFQWCKANNW